MTIKEIVKAIFGLKDSEKEEVKKALTEGAVEEVEEKPTEQTEQETLEEPKIEEKIETGGEEKTEENGEPEMEKEEKTEESVEEQEEMPVMEKSPNPIPEEVVAEEPVMEEVVVDEEGQEMPIDYQQIIDGLNAKVLAVEAENKQLRVKVEGAFGLTSKPSGNVAVKSLYNDTSDIPVMRR